MELVAGTTYYLEPAPAAAAYHRPQLSSPRAGLGANARHPRRPPPASPRPGRPGRPRRPLLCPAAPRPAPQGARAAAVTPPG